MSGGLLFCANGVSAGHREGGRAGLVPMVRRFVFRVVVPLLAGLAWSHAVWVVLLQLHDATRGNAGTHTLGAIFYNPVMFVWEAGRLPNGAWGRRALYAYYATLTIVVWNGGSGRQWFRLAAVAYGLHLAANLAACVLYVSPLPIPGLARYFLVGDLRATGRVAEADPAGLALYGACLLAWHAAVGWRM